MQEHQAAHLEICVGLAFNFTNDELDINWFGSPADILAGAQGSVHRVREVAHHLQTRIEAQQVFKRPLPLSFHGNVHAVPLMHLLDAILQNDPMQVTAILAANPNILSGQHDIGATPLIAAAATGNMEILNLLIQRTNNVDQADDFQMTALHWTAGIGRVEACKTLVAAGADRSLRSSFLWTPAHVAHANGHVALASLLVKGVVTNSWLDEPMELLGEMGC